MDIVLLLARPTIDQHSPNQFEMASWNSFLGTEQAGLFLPAIVTPLSPTVDENGDKLYRHLLVRLSVFRILLHGKASAMKIRESWNSFSLCHMKVFLAIVRYWYLGGVWHADWMYRRSKNWSIGCLAKAFLDSVSASVIHNTQSLCRYLMTAPINRIHGIYCMSGLRCQYFFSHGRIVSMRNS